MTVETPPHVAADPALPHLDAALTPVVAARAIAAAKHFAGTGVAIRSAALMRHKPGRRAVLAYTMDVAWPDGRVERVPAIAKMRAARPPRTAYRLLRALWRGGFSAASPDGISVPEPLGVVPALGLWLQRRVEGRVATDLLATPAGPALARRVAAAAFKLHQAGIAPEKTHGPAAELAILERVIAEARRARPGLAAGCDRLLDGCRRLAGALAGPVTAIHRDFYADQIIVDGERLVLLDFDLYCEGHAGLDLGNFAGHLVEHGLREPAHAPRLAAAAAALEDEYVRLAGKAVRRSIRAYTALTLARHVYLSTVIPGRAHTTAAVLDAALTLLEAPVDGHA